MPPRPVAAVRAAAAVVVEGLERRALLSGDGADCALDGTGVSGETLAVALPVKAAVKSAAVVPTASAAERFVGTYRGTGDRFEPPFDYNSFDIDVVVTSVSADGFIGSITLDTTRYNGNRREVARSFTGTLKPNGRFGFRLREAGLRVSFRGRLTTETDRLVGKVRMKVGPGMNIPRGEVGGTYVLFRATPTAAPSATGVAT